jgi:hypothetical protein
MNTTNLAELAKGLVTPVEAPASFVHSQILGPDEDDEQDVDEWIALDGGVAHRIITAGERVILRWPAVDLKNAPRIAELMFEAVVEGATGSALEASVRALAAAIGARIPVRAALAFGETGIDCYRAAAATRRIIGTAVPIRARWDGPLDVKGAALALTFGADEIAGPLAPEKQRHKLAQIGGPPEDGGRPSPAYVESLIKAAGRFAARRR